MKKLEKLPMPKAKRIFDIVFALLILFFSLPLSLIILAAIFLDHLRQGKFGAPLFYTEKRISQGEQFNFIKFNIFKPDVIARLKQAGEFIYTKELEHDGKSTTFTGHLIQKVYLDELPQLFNVLKGEMSIVGPRPVNTVVYQKDLARGLVTAKLVRAGLTGNYQAHKGLGKRTKYELEKEYIDFCANNPAWKILFYDLKIIFHTLIIIFRAEGI